MSMTITVDVGTVRIAYDLLDDAGVTDIEVALDTMLDVVRSERFRALVSASASASASASSSTSTSASTLASASIFSADSPAVSGDVYEFVALRKSDRGELRAVSSSGKYARYGMSLGDLKDEYLKRAGLSLSAANALAHGSHLTHQVVTMRVDPSGAVFV